MNENFTKIIDYSLLPFSLIILGKTIGLYLVFTSLNIDWGVADFANSFISTTPIVYGKDLVTVSTYSNLFMFIIFFGIFIVQLTLATYRQYSTSNITLLRKIMQLPIINIFERSKLLYTRLTVWTIYLWLITLYIIFDSIVGNTNGILAILTFIVSVISSAILFIDANKEFEEILKFRGNKNLLKHI